MSKSIIICLSSFLVGIAFGIFIGCFISKSEEYPNQLVEYEELPYLNDTLFHTSKKQDNSRFSPFRIEKGVIPNASAAAKIAYDYIFAIYGEYEAIKEQPYHIRLINGQTWEVNGYLSPNAVGGVFNIALDKRTGKILYISHEK